MKASNLASMIDHTLLKPDGTAKDIDRLCQEALQVGFGAGRANAPWVSRAAVPLTESSVEVCTVVGVPLGAATRDAQVAETQQALRDRASQIHMGINVGALRSRDDRRVEEDIRAVV